MFAVLLFASTYTLFLLGYNVHPLLWTAAVLCLVYTEMDRRFQFGKRK